MAGEQDSAEKSLPATEEKLRKAREKGEIPQSADATTAAAYGGFALAMAFASGGLVTLGGGLMRLLDQSSELSAAVFAGAGRPVIGPSVMSGLGSLAPFFLLPAIAAMLALAAQRAPVFAPSKLMPKGSRISPLSNAKQKLGANGIVEFLKASAKLVIMGVMLGVYLSANIEGIVAAAALPPGPALAQMGNLLLGLMLRVVIVAAIFAMIDLFWQHMSFNKKQMMSLKEMRDEMKESEGDPMLKHQRRQRAVSIATTPLRKAVAEADVIIVNPTHYAVALSWDRASGRAPVCTAKGVDEIAARMREIANENGIPIHSDPPTARALFAEIAIGQEIDRKHYRAVAAAIRFAERIRSMARK